MLLIQAGAGAPDCEWHGPDRSQHGSGGVLPDPRQPLIAFLGGSETCGRDISQPFPALVEGAINRPVANLSAPHAGPDYFLCRPELLAVASRAEVAVLQLSGADVLSNPFYSVHCRRNDRFLAARPALRALFPEVDVTDIHFTRHLLQVLARTDDDRYACVAKVLRLTWLSRMRALLRRLQVPCILLTLGDPASGDGGDGLPFLVNAAMLDSLRPHARAVVTAPASVQRRGPDPGHAAAGKPQYLPGPAEHVDIADRLLSELRPVRHQARLLLRDPMTCGQVA